jgi:hypothetical protein
LLDTFFLVFTIVDALDLYRIYIIDHILLSAAGSKNDTQQKDIKRTTD